MNVMESCFIHGDYYMGPSKHAPGECPDCKKERLAREAKGDDDDAK